MPLNVVFCLDSINIGGTEMNAVRVAERMDPARFRLSVVCFRANGALRPRFDAAGIPVYEFPVRSLYGASMIREGMRFAAFLRRERIDVVHAHDRYANVFGAVFARLAGTRCIITSKRWGSISRVHAAGNRLAYALSNRVLGNSSRVGESLVSEDGVTPAKVVVIPNFVDDALFNEPDPAWLARLRDELSLRDGAPVVGIVANLRVIKDHRSLIRAVALLRDRFPSLVLVMMGAGDQQTALEALGAELGVAPMLRFAGVRPNLPNLNRLFDVSVLCSLSEGFPNTLVEAMAAGRPVVATQVGGIVDAVEEERNGLLVPVGSPPALATALERLLGDPELRRRFGEEGRAMARSRFTAAAVLPALADLYERLCGTK